MGSTLLGIWAHPDDETFLSSGLVLAARERGERVVVVTATRGELGTDDPLRWPADRLGALRERELDAALALLGVTEHRWLAYRDGQLPLVPDAQAVDTLAAIVADVRPVTIVTFGPDGTTGHPDHRAVARWVERARAAAAPEAVLLQSVLPPRFTHRFADHNARFGVFLDEPSAEVEPDVHLRLAGDQLDRKVAALRAHDSQTRRMVDGVGLEAFRRWWADEAFAVLEPAVERAA